MLLAYYTKGIIQPEVKTLYVQSFIDKKSSQLIFYLDGFWYENLPYKELENFMWDTLEEWTQVKSVHSQLYTHKERIFWHILHQSQFVSADSLQNDEILKAEIRLCIEYLKNNGPCPFDVVGMRP